jgi:plastocyanin
VTNGSLTGGGIVSQNAFGPPVCGILAIGEPLCTFKERNDGEIAGPNYGADWQQVLSTGKYVGAYSDWNIKISAPPGTYHFFCTIHPGQRGTLTVVPPNQPSTSQSSVDTGSIKQLADDRASAISAERAANRLDFTGGPPGTRIYQVRMGVNEAHNRVAVDEILPNKPLQLAPGDSVLFSMPDRHNSHTVTFSEPTDIWPFGVDCRNRYIAFPTAGPNSSVAALSTWLCDKPDDPVTEVVTDPGNAPSPAHLTNPNNFVDSGVLLGPDFGAPAAVQQWSVIADNPGRYRYHCIIHDWMESSITVSG